MTRIRLDGSRNLRVESNEISGASGAGIALAGSDSNVVLTNTVVDVSEAGIAIGEPGQGSDDNTVDGNELVGSSGAGIAVVESTGNGITGNVATDSGSAGIELMLATDTVVRGNQITANAGGIELAQSSDNVIEGNRVDGSNGTGIVLEATSLRNDLTLNSVSGSSGDGVYVGDSTTTSNGNTVARNNLNANGGNGILVSGAGHTVTANTVTFNDGWGILASPGTVDGGGNEAGGNVEPAQCSGVVCSLVEAPGAPDTEIVDRPLDPSNSRRALFTFIGSDDTTALGDLGFECRLDSSDPLAWVECENPQEYDGLEPGQHVFEVRAVDADERVDPTPRCTSGRTWHSTRPIHPTRRSTSRRRRRHR